LRQLQ